jgi:hypothetical protein
VEKLIAKCRLDYKVPGCYVIDSIVRSSRHKFGVDKDMYGPRFAKNLLTTTRNLMKCSVTDEEKILRVLGLWQSKQIFSDDITKAAIALAKEESKQNKAADESLKQTLQDPGNTALTSSWPLSRQPISPSISVPMSLQAYSTYNGGFMPSVSSGQVASVQQFWPQVENTSQYSQGYVDDFDYEDDSSDNDQFQHSTEAIKQPQLPSGSKQKENGYIPGLPPLPGDETHKQSDGQTMRREDESQAEPSKAERDKLIPGQRIIKRLQKPQTVRQEDDMDIDSDSDHSFSKDQTDTTEQTETGKQETGKQEAGKQETDKNSNSQSNLGMKRPHSKDVDPHRKAKRQSRWGDELGKTSTLSQGIESQRETEWGDRISRIQPIQNQDDVTHLPLERDIRNDTFYEGYPRNIVANEGRGCVERRPVDVRGFEEDTWGGRWSNKGFRERERERINEQPWDHGNRKEGFPVVRKDTLSVCSCTVWVGHLKKSVTERQVRGLFEEYGEIQSVDMVLPRGCAYVCMVRRHDAARAIDEFTDRKVLLGRQPCKFAWAFPKGCSSFREYWHEPLGVVYVPWEKLSSSRVDVRSLSQGSILDPRTVPPNLRHEYDSVMSEKEFKQPTPPPIEAFSIKPPIPISLPLPPPLPLTRFNPPPPFPMHRFPGDMPVYHDNFYNQNRFH